MKTERRQNTRIQPDDLTYLSLEPENGGILLDVSEGGLGFHAVAPVAGTGPIRFWFSFKAGDRLEGVGELAWTDETRKVGGLRFTHLAEGVREQIRSAVARSILPTTSVAPPKESPGSYGSRPGEEFASASQAPRQHDAASFEPRNPTTIVPSQFGLAPEPEPMWEPIAAIDPRSVPRPPFLPTVTAGILVLLALTAVFLFLTHRRELGDLLVRFGERMAPKKESQTVPPVPTAAIPAPNPSRPEPLSTDKTNIGDASGQSPLTPTTPEPVEPSAASEPPENARPSKPAVAQQDSRGSSKQEKASGARGLWAAVEKGDTGAEVLLAELYRTGDGVRKNCQQARALLIAASRKGNTRAMEKLRQLNRNGCR